MKTIQPNPLMAILVIFLFTFSSIPTQAQEDKINNLNIEEAINNSQDLINKSQEIIKKSQEISEKSQEIIKQHRELERQIQEEEKQREEEEKREAEAREEAMQADSLWLTSNMVNFYEAYENCSNIVRETEISFMRKTTKETIEECKEYGIDYKAILLKELGDETRMKKLLLFYEME